MSFLRAFVLLCTMVATQSSASEPLIIAHRGASHDAPENTLSAVDLSIEQGADGFEADFYLTCDCKIACFHDKDTERIAGKKYDIVRTPWSCLETLDVGKWKDLKFEGERMPNMRQVLAAVPKGKLIFIELKSSTEIICPMKREIEQSGLDPKQIVVISFHADAIAKSKREMPHVKALWLSGYKKNKDGKFTPGVEEVAKTLKRIKADGFNSEGNRKHFNKAFIDRLRELGCDEFSVWTIDKPKDAKYYRDLGAWAITTNRPGWLREKMEKPVSGG
jgi:glycerophosphoryl diester phosphodiesterase